MSETVTSVAAPAAAPTPLAPEFVSDRVFARVEDGVVAETLTTRWDPKVHMHPGLVFLNVTDVSPRPAVGWSANASAGTFAPPLPVAPPARQWSSLEFMALFTDAEQHAIVSAAFALAAQGSTDMFRWYGSCLGAGFILLDDPRTIEGIHALEAGGLITAERGAQVLAGITPAAPAPTPTPAPTPAPAS